jgi:hypothetical protein
MSWEAPAWQERPPRWLTERPVLQGCLAIVAHAAVAQLPRAVIWSANMAFRQSVFGRVGGFDPRRGIRGTRLYWGESG